jgi:hypothetical protein
VFSLQTSLLFFFSSLTLSKELLMATWQDPNAGAFIGQFGFFERLHGAKCGV